jgi:hypothetical protein
VRFLKVLTGYRGIHCGRNQTIREELNMSDIQGEMFRLLNETGSSFTENGRK